MERSILYIEKGNRSTIVHYINDEWEELSVLPERYLDYLCLQQLTTLEGRVEATKKKYQIVKNVPIYIKEDLILFQTKSKKALDNIYINSMYIRKIQEEKNQTKVTFYDNQIIVVDKSYHAIKLNYEKCIKIKNQINQYC